MWPPLSTWSLNKPGSETPSQVRLYPISYPIFVSLNLPYRRLRFAEHPWPLLRPPSDSCPPPAPPRYRSHCNKETASQVQSFAGRLIHSTPRFVQKIRFAVAIFIPYLVKVKKIEGQDPTERPLKSFFFYFLRASRVDSRRTSKSLFLAKCQNTIWCYIID